MSKIALYRRSSLTRQICNTMKKWLLIFSMFFSGFASSQEREIFLYKGPAPGSENWSWTEKTFFVKTPLNANVLYNITNPSLLVFAPDPAVANGTSIIVCPGGAFHVLNIEREGTNIAKELVRKGITVFVFKYRLEHSLTDDPWQEMRRSKANADSFLRRISVIKDMARSDLNIAIAYVKRHAAELKLDSSRVGVVGFSGGGAMAANIAYNFKPEARPDFIAPIYCVLTAINERIVKPNAPPLFIAAASDDTLAPASHSITLYNDWLNAKRPVELHIYSKGGHGLWGMPAESWIRRFEEWLDGLGYLKPRQ